MALSGSALKGAALSLPGGEFVQSYRTIQMEAACEFVERRSRFIGAVRPVTSEEEAQRFIEERRRLHWNATHNVYAYCLRNGQLRRFSDDGEPQGTAGMPVLDVLQKEGVTDCAVVVTRYFGGILLGAGGLVRAYSHSASLAVQAGGVVDMRPCYRAAIACDYHQYGRVASLIPAAGGFLEDTVYTDSVEVTFILPCERLEATQKQLTELSAGSLTITVQEELYRPFAVQA